jgi:SAM-dependent methyltransferase
MSGGEVDPQGLDALRAYWDERAASGRDDCERVEQSLRTQRMRFEAFVTGHELRGRSLLDVGCGAGGLWEHLQARGIDCEYTGVDLSNAMVERCRQRFPNVRFEHGNILDWEPTPRFDYVVSIGIHNIRVPGAWELLEKTTRQQLALARVAAHVSILTDRYLGFAPHIQAWRAEQVLSLALATTPYVQLQHHYLPNDFSVTLYRQPVIDTRTDLLLE